MSASGQTSHLHLSQYVETDRPSYIDDYSDDMQRIDTGFNLAQNNALMALQRSASNAAATQALSSRVDALEQSESGAASPVYELRRRSGDIEGSVSAQSQGEMLLLTFPSVVSSSGNVPWNIGYDSTFILPEGDYIIQARASIVHSGYTSKCDAIGLLYGSTAEAVTPCVLLGAQEGGSSYSGTLCTVIHSNGVAPCAVAYSFQFAGDVSASAKYSLSGMNLSIVALS